MSEQTPEPKESSTPTFTPRPAQEAILNYSGGPMGVSAVPGSGKTFTLSLLAARLVERLASEGRLDDRELLVVTFTNSAVENFRSRIGNFLREERGLLPGVGYRVRTLHGLAHDIVRERPALVGLSETFDIVDERTANEIKRDSVLAYLRTNPDFASAYILPDYLQNFRRIERYVTDDAMEIANALIRVGKELRVQPHELRSLLDVQAGSWPLLDFGLHIFADYQRSLFIRGAVDFDDLIVLALQALDADPEFLERLQLRWPYVLEDEAQDSSALQEQMLRTLTAAHGNWVRVGDPNQAINTTFTSADTRFLREFLQRYPAGARELPNSGRSATPIIDAANFLIDWSRSEHPVLPSQKALAPPHILPTPPGDPQPNPLAGTPALFVYNKELTPDDEIKTVVTSVKRWLPDNRDRTVAVLVPENNRGFKLVEALDRAEVPYDDGLLRSDSATRAAARALATVVTYITQPQLSPNLERVWSDVWFVRNANWRPNEGEDDAESSSESAVDSLEVAFANRKSQIAELPQPVQTFARALRQLREPESLLFPGGSDWLDTLGWMDEAEGFRSVAEAFRVDLQRWTAATVLPPDELLLSLGNDLFTKPADLALAHQIAVHSAKLMRENPTWRLPDVALELESIAQNKRRFITISDEGGGFEPKLGQVTVATMHAAKGLEWDRVYLVGVNNFSFPGGSSGDDGDKYRGERWYVRDNLNLVEETVAQLRELHKGSLDEYRPGPATEQARIDTAAERLRLLYVGITRARRELILTYNTGRQPDRDPNDPALAFGALTRFARNNGYST